MIQMHSSLRNPSFIKVKCASLRGELLGSGLFGYEQAAFTGAAWSQPGRFELPNKGYDFPRRNRRDESPSAGQTPAHAARPSVFALVDATSWR